MANVNYYLGPYEWIDESWQHPIGTVGAIDLRNLTHMGTPAVQNGVGFFATTATLGAGYDLLGQGDLREINSTGAIKSAWDSILGYTPDGDKLVDLLYDHLTMGADPTGANGSKPLMPSNGLLVVHLGGHSPVKATQFRFGHSPETNKVLSVFQEDYRVIRALAQGGGLPVNQHRRVLDFWGEQYGVKNPHLIFIPNDLPEETPLPHNTSFSENFDGADNAAVGKQLTWVEGGDGSHWDNFSNHARKIDGSATQDERACRCTSSLSGTDHQSTVTIAVADNSALSQFGATCRHSSSTVDHYTAQGNRSPGSDTLGINKTISGTSTVVTTAVAVTYSIPDDIKIEVVGSSLEGFLNGSSEVTGTDTSITGNLFCGIYGYVPNVADGMEIDAWNTDDSLTVLGGGAASLLMGLL